jgi:D-glycero-D-manno-heptose 1,7-bisphosphate phosphatase
MLQRPAAFLDRDGVINDDSAYVYRVEEFRFLPGVLDACRSLRQAGYLLVIVTNQAGIARGYYDAGDFLNLTIWMAARFSENGAELSGVYYCPHHPDAAVDELRIACDCRKPEPGLLLRAQRELGIDMGRSFLVGDKASDIKAGHAAGVGRCFLLENERYKQANDSAVGSVDAIVRSLSAVVELVSDGTGPR